MLYSVNINEVANTTLIIPGLNFLKIPGFKNGE